MSYTNEERDFLIKIIGKEAFALVIDKPFLAACVRTAKQQQEQRARYEIETERHIYIMPLKKEVKIRYNTEKLI